MVKFAEPQHLQDSIDATREERLVMVVPKGVELELVKDCLGVFVVFVRDWLITEKRKESFFSWELCLLEFVEGIHVVIGICTFSLDKCKFVFVFEVLHWRWAWKRHQGERLPDTQATGCACTERCQGRRCFRRRWTTCIFPCCREWRWRLSWTSQWLAWRGESRSLWAVSRLWKMTGIFVSSW